METPQTIPAFFSRAVAAVPNRDAIATIHDGKLKWRTWLEIAKDVYRLANALEAKGVLPGDRVGQLSKNSYEWIVTDLAIQLIRAVHVPIHVSLGTPQIAAQISDCGAKLVIVKDSAQCSSLSKLAYSGVSLVRAEQFVSDVGHSEDDGAEFLKQLASAVKPEDVATLLYTSGTTGQSRGVMLSQENLASNTSATTEFLAGSERELRLCFLPLSHIYARTCDLYSWLYLQSRLVLTQRRETIIDDCQLVSPTTLNAVPYFYQKVYDQVRIADVENESEALRRVLGGNIRKLLCGGAALPPDVEKWFAECQMPIFAGYGLTETSPVVSASSSAFHRVGSVGKPIPGVEVRISSEQEILVRGPNLMQGYWQDELGTQETIRDGWLHTGDLGQLDEDGFLFIRSRKKELIVLSTGKNVSPTRVESLLVGSPFIEQVAVVGDGRKHLAAIIVPCAQALKAEIRRRRIFVWSRKQALRNKKVRAIISEDIARRLAGSAREEQVHSFVLLGRGFSVEAGEYTPKLSLRRSIISQRFSKAIDRMYRQ